MPSIELLKITGEHHAVLKQIEREISLCEMHRSEARGANKTRVDARLWAWRAAKKGVRDIFEKPDPSGADAEGARE